MNFINKKLYSLSKDIAEYYKNDIKNADDQALQIIAEGAYMNYNGINHSIDEIEKGSKPYYDYLKSENQEKDNYDDEVMIECNYTTPYSFEYEPYFSNNNNYSITFDHEVDTSNSIQMIEELYNEDNNIEEDVDSNDVINIMDVLTHKISKVKKSIIHYISNYRPIMNQYTDTIEVVLIE